MKKYLKIATPAKLQADIAKKWPTVELTPELSGAKLAAIVIEAGDRKQRALAESICQRSSLKLPLIEVTAENIATDMKRILELATHVIQQGKSLKTFLAIISYTPTLVIRSLSWAIP